MLGEWLGQENKWITSFLVTFRRCPLRNLSLFRLVREVESDLVRFLVRLDQKMSFMDVGQSFTSVVHKDDVLKLVDEPLLQRAKPWRTIIVFAHIFCAKVKTPN